MRLYRHVLRRVDMTLFGAEVQCRLWEARYQLSTSRGHCAVLYNGVDTNKFTPRAIEPAPRTELPPCRFLIGTVGRLWPEKAHVDLVRAVAALRAKGLDAGACIVGEGPERARIEAEIRRTGTEGIVRIVGERADVRPYLARMQVFVLSSIAVETFSNATLEAMAMGCPIVAARLGGMEEMLRFGGGLTYPPADVAALSERLFELLTDPALRERAGFEARQAVVTHFGWNQMVSDFEAHLRRLSRSGSSRTGLPAPLA
jgi:glycosyltransferase involved in cell wall biosynthesis